MRTAGKSFNYVIHRQVFKPTFFFVQQQRLLENMIIKPLLQSESVKFKKLTFYYMSLHLYLFQEYGWEEWGVNSFYHAPSTANRAHPLELANFSLFKKKTIASRVCNGFLKFIQLLSKCTQLSSINIICRESRCSEMQNMIVLS